MRTRERHGVAARGPAGEPILWLGDPRASDPELTGGKAASLSRLAADFEVPDGFVVVLGDGIPSHSTHGAVREAYRQLGAVAGSENPAVAVRSSAVDEDGESASFAGQHETHLSVTGEDRVLFALAHCVASFYSERARDYRLGQGLPAEPGRVAVLVQLMAPADAAGVVFTADPVRGDRDRVLVNASLGLGESVVGGTVTPDLYVVDRRTLALTERHIARKARMTVAGPEGTREVPVPRRLADLPALTPCQARSAARLALEVERSAGAPVDIEVAFAGDRIFLLQSRPITTLPTRRLSP